MHQIQESLTRIESSQNLFNLIFSRHPNVAHLHNVDFRYDFPQQYSAYGCFMAFALHAQRDGVMQADRSGIIGNSNLLGVGENHSGALAGSNGTGHIIDTQHNILAWNDNGAAIGRRQNIVA